MTDTEERIKEGTVIMYDGYRNEKAYVILCFMENGIALCEDNTGNRFRFSRNKLSRATEKQWNDFYNVK